MKKKFLAVTVAAAFAVSLIGCSSGASGSSSTSSASSASSASGTSGSDAAISSTDETASAGEETASADSDVEYIKEKGTLIVGITDFAPMDYKDDSGEWIGFDADMAKKVAESLGVEVEFVEIDWDNKILELENKSIDVVWNGMTLTDEVKSAMECTDAYMMNAQVVVVKQEDAETYQTPDSLEGITFAVEAGSAGEDAAAELGADYTSVLTQADALMEVNAGTSDACIIDLLMAGAMIGEGTSYENLTYTVALTSEEYGIGCRKGSDLAAYIDECLDGFYADGSMLEIAETYGVQEALAER